MALLSSPSPPPIINTSTETSRSRNLNSCSFYSRNLRCTAIATRFQNQNQNQNQSLFQLTITSQLCTTDETPITLDKSFVNIKEAVAEDELWATASLRVRTFFVTQHEPHQLKDHLKYLAEREFEALKERIAGKRIGFKRVSCINATVPVSCIPCSLDDLHSVCKYSENGEDRIVIGTLDLNQCLSLPDEITGKRPEVVGSDLARAYLSNVCVAKELHKNGIGSSLVARSKKFAREWGITDLYVHVAFDNEPARKLYIKSGFVYENDEPAWQARFLDRPRRLLLWTDVSGSKSS